MYDRFIGIDVGKTGALALIDNETGLIDVKRCPVIINGTKREYDLNRMGSLLYTWVNYPDTVVVIEKQHAMPKQGVVSVFSLGYGFAVWETLCVAWMQPYELVTPQRWKKEMLADIGGDDKKAKSIIAVKRIFPIMTAEYKKKDHDLAEAILIAEWGRRKYGKEEN